MEGKFRGGGALSLPFPTSLTDLLDAFFVFDEQLHPGDVDVQPGALRRPLHRGVEAAVVFAGAHKDKRPTGIQFLKFRANPELEKRNNDFSDFFSRRKQAGGLTLLASLPGFWHLEGTERRACYFASKTQILNSHLNRKNNVAQKNESLKKKVRTSLQNLL